MHITGIQYIFPRTYVSHHGFFGSWLVIVSCNVLALQTDQPCHAHKPFRFFYLQQLKTTRQSEACYRNTIRFVYHEKATVLLVKHVMQIISSNHIPGGTDLLRSSAGASWMTSHHKFRFSLTTCQLFCEVAHIDNRTSMAGIRCGGSNDSSPFGGTDP